MTPTLRPLLAAACALVAGCGFTNEPDPGGFGDGDGGVEMRPDFGSPSEDMQAHEPPADADVFDASPEADALPDAPDMGAADAHAPDADAPPFDAEPFDAEPFDAEPSDAEPSDAEPSDAEPSDAEPSDAELPDTGLDAGPDAGPPTVDALCEQACRAIIACAPGADIAECLRECHAEDEDHPGTAARLAECTALHVEGGRCDLAALDPCVDDPPPLPEDPRCAATCDALAACDLPARPDCADECTADPGPERARLARCVEAHVAGDRCDALGFFGCADGPPGVEDACAFVCAAREACLGPQPDCRAACFDAGGWPDAIECAALHLDHGACRADDHRACLAP